MSVLHAAKALTPFILNVHHALLLVLRAKPPTLDAWNIEIRLLHAAKVLTPSAQYVHHVLLLVL